MEHPLGELGVRTRPPVCSGCDSRHIPAHGEQRGGKGERSGCSQFAAGICVLRAVASILMTSLGFDAVRSSTRARSTLALTTLHSLLMFNLPLWPADQLQIRL
ncbi:hypothetical protein V8C42DRAFT_309523 [Trichoderma barbatum]